MKELTQKLPIHQWAEDDRPREKLLIKGKAQLSNAELIAILIGSGNQEESAVQLSKSIMNSVKNNLAELSKMNVKDFTKFKGIGEAKAISIIAGLELGKRRLSEEVIEKKNFVEFWIDYGYWGYWGIMGIMGIKGIEGIEGIEGIGGIGGRTLIRGTQASQPAYWSRPVALLALGIR